ncbi:MAG: hypothetical protein NTW14_10415 [bacterium]|nr:hypothetical protein [bacterium]
MKRISAYLPYVLIMILGLLWVAGCSSSPTGSGGPISYYRIDLTLTPQSLPSGDPNGAKVNCFLFYGDSLSAGQTVRFRAASDALSNIASSSVSSDTSATGVWPPVTYRPLDVPPGVDTVFATFLANDLTTVLAADTVVVTIQ